MSKLDPYKKEYLNKNIQFILTDNNGIILESDDAFISIVANTSIYDLHPFFSCLTDIQESTKEEMTFNCVNMSFDAIKYTIDVKVAKKKNKILVVLYNLTEHYHDYQTIAQSRNESIINEELVVLKNLELEERERFKNSFIQNFSHELRNPLTSIISITKIIGDTDLNNEQKNMLDFLNESNNNLKLMLEDILSISLINTGRLKLESKVFSLTKLLDLLAFTYTAKANEKGLDFEVKSGVKIPELIEGDRLRLFQVLTNLLDNAVKYTNEGKVSLQISFNQKRANKIGLRFQVDDTGFGIPSESSETIFESFSRLDHSDLQSGTGIGLSVVSGLLKLMNSEIKLESTVGEGSRFYFDVVLKYPLQLASKPLPKVKAKKKLKISLPEDGRKFRLLLVEDDLQVQMVLFKFLMKTNYFYVDLLNDGAMVMGELVNETYDIILMDVNLPNINGDEVTKLIRGFPFKNIKKVPVIGLTANAYDADKKVYLDAGMNAVITKPFEEELLLTTLSKFLK